MVTAQLQAKKILPVNMKAQRIDFLFRFFLKNHNITLIRPKPGRGGLRSPRQFRECMTKGYGEYAWQIDERWRIYGLPVLQ